MDAGSPVIRKISLFGNFGTLNIGNECTLQAIIHNIRRFLPGAEVHCICSIPEDVRERHHILALPMSRRSTRMSSSTSSRGPGGTVLRLLRGLFVRVPDEMKELTRIRRILKGRDMLIMAGTGMLADGGEGSLGLPFEIFKWALVAKLSKLRVLFVSVGVEPIRHRLTRWLVKLSLDRADHISFRDRQSQDYMAAMGFRKRSLIFPDLAFSLPEQLSGSAERTTTAPAVVGVGLYDYRGRGLGLGEADRRAYDDYLTKIADFVEWLVKKDHPVRVIIGDISYDTAVRGDLRERLEGRGLSFGDHGILDETITSVDDLLEQIRTTDIVVASRFHNVILSLLLAKPVISISYNPKNDAVMAESGLPEYCLRIADFDVAGLVEKFGMIEGQRRDIPLRIKARTRGFREALDEQYRRIFATVSK